MLGSSRVAAQLAASQKGLCSMSECVRITQQDAFLEENTVSHMEINLSFNIIIKVWEGANQN
jgi:hypothetical protein